LKEENKLTDHLVSLFSNSLPLTVFISILLNILIAVFGFLPSSFLNAANLIVFGFLYGTLLSLVGEILGSLVAFFLYRKGFQTNIGKKLGNSSKFQSLLHAEGKEAFMLILSLRLIPFVPSGLVTFFSAIGKVSFLTFALSSSLGKIPALFIEAYAIYQVTNVTVQGKIILALTGCLLIAFIWKKYKKNKKSTY